MIEDVAAYRAERPGLVLGYGAIAESDIAEGLRLLDEVW